MLPLLALKGAAVAKSALGIASSAEAARTATSKLAMFAREVDESTKTIARLAGGQHAGAPAADGAEGQHAPTTVVKDGVHEPVVEHPDQVWKHRETPDWFVRKIVKVRFRTEDGVEYIWVQVLAVAPKGKATLVGRLANAPELLESQLGDVVTFPLKDVVDVQAAAKRSRRRRGRR